MYRDKEDENVTYEIRYGGLQKKHGRGGGGGEEEEKNLTIKSKGGDEQKAGNVQHKGEIKSNSKKDMKRKPKIKK
jgi:hypothetical protein